MLGTILEKAQGLLSRGFILGAFFPVLVFAAANAAMAWLGLAGARPTLRAAWNAAEAHLSVLVALFIAIAVAAYVLSALTLVISRALAGEYLPTFLKKAMCARYARIASAQRNAIEAAAQAFAQLRSEAAEVIPRLQQAKQTGDAAGDVTDPALVAEADRQLQLVITARAEGALTVPQLQAAIAAATAALRANASNLDPPHPGADQSARLSDIHGKLISEARKSVDDAEREITQRTYRLYAEMVPNDPQPTRFGNSVAVTEKYSENAYGANFAYLWPRLNLVLPKDEKFATVVELARSQLDFALLMLTLSLVFTVFWLPTLILFGTSPSLFIAVGVFGPLCVHFFYLVVVASQANFAEAVKTAVDGLRHDLLAAMHLPRPRSLSSERHLWRLLASTHDPASDVDYPFKFGQK